MSTQQFLTIDGSVGEGGGQILRSALALAICYGKAFKITGIRAKRKKPGLLRQHLTAVKAATQISHAKIEGDTLGSQQLIFEPNPVQAGEYHFAIGSAGSTTLVLQTILMPLLFAKGPSKMHIEGGTHNPLAPPFEFLAQAFLPVLKKMGASIDIALIRPGFFPAGGGAIAVEIMPVGALQTLHLTERGKIIQHNAQVLITGIPRDIAEREIKALKQKLNWPDACFEIIQDRSSRGPGNIISMKVTSENACEVFTGFGQKGVRAESIANKLVKTVNRYIASDVPVGEHLADQLLLPFALAGGGEFITTTPSPHTITNMAIIEQFSTTKFATTVVDQNRYRISVIPNESKTMN